MLGGTIDYFKLYSILSTDVNVVESMCRISFQTRSTETECVELRPTPLSARSQPTLESNSGTSHDSCASDAISLL